MTVSPLTARPYRRGVGALIVNAAGQVLVARRADMPHAAWQLPQGGMKKGETPEDAVLREVLEEVGTTRVEIIARSAGWLRYDLPADLAQRAWKGKYRGQEQQWFVLRFVGTDDDIDLAAAAQPEFVSWRWQDVRSLPTLAAPFKRALYDALVDEFADTVEGMDRSGAGVAPS